MMAAILGGSPARALNLRVHVQAPIDFKVPSQTDLNNLETYGSKPEFQRSVSIDFDAITAAINTTLLALPGISGSGEETCSWPCPDIRWSYSITPKFTFIEENQPTAQLIVATSGVRRLRVGVSVAGRFEAKLKARAEATIISDVSTSETADAFIDIRVTATSDVELWPEVKTLKPETEQPGSEVLLQVLDTNLNLQLNDTLVPIGGVFGTLAGFGAGGLIGGLWGLTIAAILSSSAANTVEDLITKAFQNAIEDAIPLIEFRLGTELTSLISGGLAIPRKLEAELMQKKLPKVNLSIQDLLIQSGGSLEIHHNASASGVAISAVTRFSDVPGSARVTGIARFPKQHCSSIRFNFGGFKRHMPLGLVDFNQELKPHVGTACREVFSGGLETRVYLGGSPAKVLGAGAPDRPMWSSAGVFQWSGVLSEKQEWYECGFQVAGLPTAAFVEIAPSLRLTDFGIAKPVRIYARAVGTGPNAQSIMLDHRLNPVLAVNIGEPGRCEGGGQSGGLAPNALRELEDILNFDKCPTCDVQKIGIWNKVFEVRNVDALLQTPPGKEMRQLIALQSGEGVCAGDCNGDGTVGIHELVLGVRIALRLDEPSACVALDRNRDGAVAINELIESVNAAAKGCKEISSATPSPTHTEMHTPTAVAPTPMQTPTPTASATPSATELPISPPVVRIVRPLAGARFYDDFTVEFTAMRPASLGNATEWSINYQITARQVSSNGERGPEIPIRTGFATSIPIAPQQELSGGGRVQQFPNFWPRCGGVIDMEILVRVQVVGAGAAQRTVLVQSARGPC